MEIPLNKTLYGKKHVNIAMKKIIPIIKKNTALPNLLLKSKECIKKVVKIQAILRLQNSKIIII